MRTLLLLGVLTFFPVSRSFAAPDAELKALLAENNTSSQKIVDYADAKAAELVAAQAEIATLKQQFAAEQAARVQAEAERDAALVERDAARQAVAQAKATIEAVVAKL